MWHLSWNFSQLQNNRFRLYRLVFLHFLQFIFTIKIFLTKFKKRAVNFFFPTVVSSFLSDHTCVFCSSFVDLRILIPCRQGDMHFDTYFWICFSLIFRIFWQFSFSYYSLIWYLGARNIKLSIIESYCLWVDIRCVSSFQFCFHIPECLSQQLLKVSFKHNFLNILTGWKKMSLH